jgi:hypothetical protein
VLEGWDGDEDRESHHRGKQNSICSWQPRAAGVRQLELGPLVRMSARRGLTVSRVGVAYSFDSGETIARETPNWLAALSDPAPSYAPGSQLAVRSAERDYGSGACWKCRRCWCVTA